MSDLVTREAAKSRRDIEEVAAMMVDAALQLHRDLGPGLLESVYEAVLKRFETLKDKDPQLVDRVLLAKPLENSSH